MDVNIRQANPGDAAECGRICYEAFTAVATAQSFPVDFPGVDTAVGLVSMLLAHEKFYGMVAEAPPVCDWFRRAIIPGLK